MFRIVPSVVLSLLAVAAAAATGLSQQTIQSWSGTFVEGFGMSLSPAGDVDGDGLPDVLVGSDGAFVGAHRYARVYSGTTGAILLAIPIPEMDVGPISVGRVGDVNGDGRDDVILGAFAQDAVGIGRARVCSGAGGAAIHDLVSDAPFDGLGWSVCGTGDVDGDGVPDFAVGLVDRHAVANPPVLDRVRVYSGATGLVLHEQVGGAPGERFGFAIADAGDVNADGVHDLVVGAPQYGSGAGYARVYWSGAAAGHLLVSPHAGVLAFGAAVGSPGDLDGDGSSELIVGAPDSGPAAVGRTEIFDGNSGVHVSGFTTGAAGANSGSSVFSAGDANLDGVPDFGIGSAFGVGTFSGADESLLLWPSIGLSKPGAGNYGRVCAGVGDTGGDGVPDVALREWEQPAPSTVDLVSLLPAGTKLYGAGSPGCSGPHRLLPVTQPVLGSAVFRFAADGVPSSRRCFVLLARTADPAGSDAFGLGIPVHVGLGGRLFALHLTAGLPGFAAASFPISPNPALVGTTYYGQAFFLETPGCAAAPFGLSSSNAVEVEILPP